MCICETEYLGTKVPQIGFFIVFYSVCKTKQTDHCMNAIGDSMNGCAEGTFDFDLELKKRSSLGTILDNNHYTLNWIPVLGAVLQGYAVQWTLNSSLK